MNDTIDGKIRIYLSILLGVGFINRFPFVIQRAVDENEALTALATFPEYLTTYTDAVNDFLYEILTIGLTYFIGISPGALRLLSLLASLALIPASYLLARRFFDDKSTALLTATLVSVMFPFLRLSAWARGYMLWTLLATFGYFSLVKILRSQDSTTWSWVRLSIVSALGCYTLPTMLLSMTHYCSWIGIHAMTKKSYKEWGLEWGKIVLYLLGAGLLVFLLYSPVFVHEGLTFMTNNPYIQPIHMSTTILFSRLAESFMNLPGHWLQPYSYAVNVLFVGFMLLGVIHSVFNQHHVQWLGWVSFPLGLLPFFYVYRIIPHLRIWIFLLPFVLVFVAKGLSWTLSGVNLVVPGKGLSTKWLTMASAVLILVSGSLLNAEQFPANKDNVTVNDQIEFTKTLKAELQRSSLPVTTPYGNPIIQYLLKWRQIPNRREDKPLLYNQRQIMVSSAKRPLRHVLNRYELSKAQSNIEVVYEDKVGVIYRITPVSD